MLPMELKIYQIDSEKDKQRVLFEGYDSLQKITKKEKPVDRDIYKCIYTMKPEDEEKFTHFDLDSLYHFLNSPNEEKPKEYKGHSLSVSDIIVVKNSCCISDGAYFCDRFGWKDVSDEFLQKDKTTRIWKVPGRYGHRQRESFCPSYEFIDIDNVSFEVFNSDKTGTNNYSIVKVTADNFAQCYDGLWAQITDGIFENSRTGVPIEITQKDLDEILSNNKKITGVLVSCDNEPEICSVENDLKSLQNIVAGNIEIYSISDTATIICNEEGKLKGLPFNCSVQTAYANEVFVGDIFIIGTDIESGEFVSLTEEEIDEYLDAFKNKEVLLDEPSICK